MALALHAVRELTPYLWRTIMPYPRAVQSLALLSLFGGVLGASAIARAHAPAKVLQYVSIAPEDVVLVTNRGLIFGNVQSRDFKLLCNEAYDVSPSEDNVRFARLPSGRMLVASSNGLHQSDDKGCTWRPNAALAGLSVPSLAQHPRELDTLYVSTYSTDEPFAGTLRVSRDGGETFQILYEPGNEYFRTVQVAPDGKHVYATGQVLTAMPSHYVARSVDGGANWERSPITLEKDELDLSLLAVNPAQPEELLARASGAEPGLGERLLWSNDGGRTFSSLGKLPALAHATFASDGSVAYVGSVAGLQRISGSPSARTLDPVMSTARISQVRELEGKVYASGYYQGLEAAIEGVGVASASALTFERWLQFNEVDEQVQCSAAVTTACRFLWDDWQRENPSAAAIADAGTGGVVVDAGGMDAGTIAAPRVDASSATRTDASGPTAASDASDGGDRDGGGGDDDGCSLAHGSGSSLPALALLAVCAWLRRRRAPGVSRD